MGELVGLRKFLFFTKRMQNFINSYELLVDHMFLVSNV